MTTAEPEPMTSDPATITREQLLGLIDHMRESIAAGDSFEGRLVYETAGRAEYRVDTFFRIGNLMGQGGAVMVTTKPLPHEEETARDGRPRCHGGGCGVGYGSCAGCPDCEQ